MNYSYVKTVFPNFKYSDVYDINVYKNVEDNDKKVSEIKNEIVETFDTLSKPTAWTPLIDSQFQEINKNNKLLSQNNTSYNKYPQSTIESPTQLTKIPFVHNETFQNDHQEYIKHVLECNQCKEILIKQFNIKQDTIFNEDFLELLSFIIFGILLLLLIDTLKRQ